MEMKVDGIVVNLPVADFIQFAKQEFSLPRTPTYHNVDNTKSIHPTLPEFKPRQTTIEKEEIKVEKAVGKHTTKEKLG